MQISISLHIRLQNYRLFFTPYRRAKECIMVGEWSFFWGRGGRRTGHFEAWGGKGLFPVSVSLFVCCVGNVCLSVACRHLAADLWAWERGMEEEKRAKNEHKKIEDNPSGCYTLYCPRSLYKVAATYSPTLRSTIGAVRLNFSVRDGKRWNPDAITTWITFDMYET